MSEQKKKKVNKKPNKTKAIVTSVLLALFVVIAVIVATLLLYKPSYDDTPDFWVTGESGFDVVITDPDGDVVVPERDDERVNVLILGKDRWAFNTDVMIIASYNVTDGQISMMQIPRDTYIDVGRGNKKANSLLASFYNEALRNKEKDPMSVAIKGMEETFEKVFCITIDYYALMDLNGFVNIVDAMGGVEVDVPTNMKYTDPYQGLYINLKKGLQTLNGDQAEQFIRFRADYVEGDIGRVDAQKIFIGACINKLKNSFNVSTISNIVKEVIEYVETDIPLADLIYYAKSALSVDLGNMTMLTLPGIQGRQYDTSGTWFYFTYRDGTIAAVNKYFNSYNFEVSKEMFDRDGALYDVDGSYMHSVFLTPHKDEESFTADNTDDIYIFQYQHSTKPATKATTASSKEETVATDESGEPVETAGSEESGVHTEAEAPLGTDETVETTDAPAETTGETDEVNVTDEINETAAVTTDESVEDPEETEVVETTEDVSDVEVPNTTDSPVETVIETTEASTAETETTEEEEENG